MDGRSAASQLYCLFGMWRLRRGGLDMGARTDHRGVWRGGNVEAGGAASAQTGSSLVSFLKLHPGIDEEVLAFE